MKTISFTILLFSILTTSFCFCATTYYVNDTTGHDTWDGLAPELDPDCIHGPKKTIQAAIDGATDGDLILLAPGTYMGVNNKNISFDGKAIVLKSTDGPEQTIVNCEKDGRGFSFSSGEPLEAVLDGLTIINGNPVGNGGGISCTYSSSPTITNCVIKDCIAISGGGLYIDEPSYPLITNCRIVKNSASGSGGGASLLNARLINCDISHNACDQTGGGGVYGDGVLLVRCTINYNRCRGSGGGVYAGNINMVNCIVKGNRSSQDTPGVYCWKGTLLIENCTIIDNILPRISSLESYNGGGLKHYSRSAIIKNCILRGNTPMQAYPGNLTLQYCNIEGGWIGPGTGNIDEEPFLTLDGHLTAGSPCLDICPSGQSQDYDGEQRPYPVAGRWDIGADEFIDSDDDELPDWWEMKYYENTVDAIPAGDDDGDGLINSDEYIQTTHPKIADIDGDDRSDGTEVIQGSNPSFADNAEKTIYVNRSSGSDTNDGLSAAWDGIHGPKKTIQAGIDATISGWNYTVLVAKGVYTGVGNKNLDPNGKLITIRSNGPPENCVIDCENAGRGFVMTKVEGPETRIIGFTIRNGNPTDYWPWGGGIRLWDASPVIRNCIIENNRSERGGGLYLYDRSEPIIENCVIRNNQTIPLSHGGGIYISGSWNNTIITDCIITGNSGGRGGGIFVSLNGQLRIYRSVISNNTSGIYGGGVYAIDRLELVIENSLVFSNTPDGIYVDNNSSLNLKNCTIAKNATGITCDTDDSVLTNSIFWGNTLNQITGKGSPVVNYCDIMGGWTGVGTGNIFVDPLFLNLATFDLHLSSLSSCVDAGDPASDYSQEPQPNGCRIDMGAYGNTPEATKSPGDVDNDLDIDVDDLILIHEALGSIGFDPRLDIDADGVVTFSDLRIAHSHMCGSLQYMGGVSTLWVLDYIMPTDPTVQGLNPYIDQSQLDNDADGKTNYEEYIAGTDPTEALSLFEISDIDFTMTINGDTITISWNAVAGKSYCLYWSSSPEETAEWLPVDGYYNVSNGIASQTIGLDGVPMCFFKVRVW
jgi:parallel beta-helix repeat protein